MRQGRNQTVVRARSAFPFDRAGRCRAYAVGIEEGLLAEGFTGLEDFEQTDVARGSGEFNRHAADVDEMQSAGGITLMEDHLTTPEPSPPARLSELPLVPTRRGREVLAEDVADAFVSLALARKTTGAVLTVDGGNIAAAPR